LRREMDSKGPKATKTVVTSPGTSSLSAEKVASASEGATDGADKAHSPSGGTAGHSSSVDAGGAVAATPISLATGLVTTPPIDQETVRPTALLESPVTSAEVPSDKEGIGAAAPLEGASVAGVAAGVVAAVFPVSHGLFVGSPAAFASAVSVDHPLFPVGDASGRISDQLELCSVLLLGELSAASLAALGVQLLADKGSLPVGEVGKLLADAIGLPSLSHILKERFGGLKRFLEAHAEVFVLGGDHPFNPTVSLADDLPGALKWLAAGDALPV
jgi:hypothetical protein